MYKRIVIIFTMFIVSIANTYGQFRELQRINITDKQYYGGRINLYNNGIAILTQKSKDYELTFYDVNLNQKGTYTFSKKSRNQEVMNYYYDSLIDRILFFCGNEKTTNLTLIDPDSKEYKTVKLITTKKKAIPNFTFVKLDKSIFLTTFLNGKSILNTIELSTGKITPVELPSQWASRSISGMSRVNSQYIALLYLDKSVKNKQFKNFAIIDDKGKVVADNLLGNNNNDFPILEFSIMDLENNQLIVSGTYTESLKADYSVGLFIAKIDNFKPAFIKYFDYNTIKNFYNYMPEKLKVQAEEEAERRALKGITTAYNAIPHSVIKINDKYILATEFCYATYTMKSDYNRSGFDGYIYTHTMILEINEDGKIDFEYCIPFKLNLKSYGSSRTLDRLVSGNEVKYYYFNENKIYSFSLKNNSIKENDPRIFIEVEDDKKLKEMAIRMDSWYNNYFFSETYQTTKEKKSIIGSKTNYYFIKYVLE